VPLPLIGWAIVSGTLVYLLSQEDQDPEVPELKSDDENGDKPSSEEDFDSEIRRLRSELRKVQRAKKRHLLKETNSSGGS